MSKFSKNRSNFGNFKYILQLKKEKRDIQIQKKKLYGLQLQKISTNHVFSSQLIGRNDNIYRKFMT